MALLDVANDALRRMGKGALTALSDATDAGYLVNGSYLAIIKRTMRAHDWRCLRAMQELQYTTVALTLSALTVGTSRTATPGAAWFTSRDVGRLIQELTTGSGVGEITAVSADPIPVATFEITAAFTGPSPLAANAWRLEPLQDGSAYAYEYAKPTNCLKVRALNDDENGAVWEEAEGRILADYTSAVVTFTRYEADETKWDAGLYESIVAAMIGEWFGPLAGKVGTAAEDEKKVHADRVFREATGQSLKEGRRVARVSPTILTDCR